MIAKALTIAGSDCSGGAGIQADLKTFAVHNVYGMSVITALTAQNTKGVTGIMDVTPQMIEEQLEAVFTDIAPDAVKIGMVSVQETISKIAKALKNYQPQYIVLDPVMISTSGYKLLSDEAIETLKKELLPCATLITPNLKEAEVLSGHKIESYEEIELAFQKISQLTDAAILIKGGHSLGNANDYLYNQGEIICFEGERIANPNTHGTGCTLSSAITSNLAKGYSLAESVREAKAYVAGALRENFDLGEGSGPLNHCYRLTEQSS